MGKHVDKILLQGLLTEEQPKEPKEVKIEKQKAFKELVERVANLEKAIEGLSELLAKKDIKQDK